MSAERPLVIVLNGPNLNLLGTREPEIYGSTTLSEIEGSVRARASDLGADVEFHHSDVELDLVAVVMGARERADALVMNPAAFTHNSYALRDAVQASELPLIEVHLSNIYAREEFRRHSVISPVARAVICGLGPEGYRVAIEAAIAAARTKGHR